jgi:hypothetical protein
MPGRVAHRSAGAAAKDPLENEKTAAPTVATTQTDEPNAACAIVEFRPSGAARNVRGTVYETIYADVTFRDGHHERAKFPYDWAYPNNGEADPWSSENLRNEKSDVTLQRPLPDTDVTTYPTLIQYLLKHTAADGKTDLRACQSGVKR